MRSRRTIIFILALSVVVLLLSAIPSRAAFAKLYTLNVAPTSVVSGGERTFTVTYTGKSSFGVGSSDLSVPAAFTGVSLVSFVAPRGTATAVGNTIQLRGMSLGNNKQAVVTLKATVPCGAATYTWSAITKSSSLVRRRSGLLAHVTEQPRHHRDRAMPAHPAAVRDAADER